MRVSIVSVLLVFACVLPTAHADESLRKEAQVAMQRAVEFYRQKVSSHGGYLYRYSADLKKQEGEGQTTRETVWVQPPGTPSVGMAYLEAFERTGEPYLLEAAEAAGECLIQGQLHSGGWQAQIDFAAADRKKMAYRVDPPRAKARNSSTFDDDKTQSALRLMMRLDAALHFRDKRVHESITFALDSVLKVQFPNGGWSQVFIEPPDPAKHPVKAASYPESWQSKYPGGDYWFWYTFNDGTIADTIDALLLASRIYKEPRYRAAALKAGDFILLAQMPEPQPAWAQQYNFDMQPAWARKFEPPAISGGESQGLVQTLLQLYVETGDSKFLKPVPSALAYFQRSELPDGKLARFYELKTNKPLYCTREYKLTHDDSDLPTHYGFKVSSKRDSLSARYEKLLLLSPEKLAAQRESRYQLSKSVPSDADVRATIKALDERGAWVEDGALKYHGKTDDTRRVIDSVTFARNLDLLSRYVGAKSP